MISIIIPHYNRSVLLKDALQSVYKQLYKNWEVIIVDDGSNEEEFSIISNYVETESKVKLLKRTSPKKGPSVCRNEGLQNSKGEFIIFLDSDDLLKDFCLQQRHQIISNSPETGIAIFLIENFTKFPGDLGTNFNINIPKEKLIAAFLENNNPWQTMAPIWRKSFLLEIGGFDEELIFMEDPDLHLRALKKDLNKLQICYNKPADCYYRIHHNDKTKTGFYYNSILYRILFLKKIIRDEKDSDFYNNYKKNIKKGILTLLNQFLFSRVNEFKDLYNQFIILLKESKLFTKSEIRRVTFLIRLGNYENVFAKKMKLKGLCYLLLPK